MKVIIFIDDLDGDYVYDIQNLMNCITVAITNGAKEIRIKIKDEPHYHRPLE